MINFDSSIILCRQLKNRNRMCRQKQNPENVENQVDGRSKDSEETTHFSNSVYDKVEENAAYQELGEITKESHYDKLS